MRKILLICLLLFTTVVVALFISTKRDNKSGSYTSKDECEKKTGKQCYLFQGLCQVGVAQNQNEAKANEKFLRECTKKIGTWQPRETASEASNYTSDLKTYRNEEFGFEFKYNPTDYGELLTDIEPKRNFNETGTGEVGLEVYFFDSFSEFNWFMNNGSFSETLRYDNATNKWVVKLAGENATKEDIYCPSEVKTKSQKLPFYVIGDSRSGRANDFGYVVDKGIIVIRNSYPSEVHQDILFDNPQKVKKVNPGCISN